MDYRRMDLRFSSIDESEGFPLTRISFSRRLAVRPQLTASWEGRVVHGHGNLRFGLRGNDRHGGLLWSIRADDVPNNRSYNRSPMHISSALGRDVALRWLAVTLVGENGHPIQVVVWEGAGLGERICCGRRASCEQGIVCGCV